MNREIKFRAWHHRGVDETQPMTMTYWGLGSGLDNSQFFKNAKAVMQYTGLKDKHGQEIYEGDVIERNGNRHVMTWQTAYAGFGLGDGDLITLPGVIHEDWQVIGNVYENPELLAAQQGSQEANDA